MTFNKIKDDVQNTAIAKWIALTEKRGTVESITGIGKTFIFLKALYTMPKGEKDTIHLFLAESTEREKDLVEEIKKFNALFDVNVLEDYNLQFHCYQTVYKWQKCKFGLVCCDEIHDQLSPAYIKFHLNNKCEAILGLSAKINGYINYSLKREPELHMYFGQSLVTKLDILNKVAPICFRYTTDDGQKDGTSRKLNIYVIKNKLDDKYRNIKAGNAKNYFYQTEADAYKYATSLLEKAVNLEIKEKETIQDYEQRKEARVLAALFKRNNLLYSLYSKKLIVDNLVFRLKGKSIIFGNNLDALELIIPGRVLSSKNYDKENDLIRKCFDEGKIRVIGSFKKIKQGANLNEVDNCIIKDYYSSEVDFIQRVGRLRENKGKVGHVFVIVTEGTQEVSWFNKMVANSKEYNYILCENFKEALNEYDKHENSES